MYIECATSHPNLVSFPFYTIPRIFYLATCFLSFSYKLSVNHRVGASPYQCVGRRSSYVCRDETSQISRDLRKNCLYKISARMSNQAFKTNQNSLPGQYPAIHVLKSVVCGSSALRENPFSVLLLRKATQNYVTPSLYLVKNTIMDRSA